MGKNKEFQDYITKAQSQKVGHGEYILSPGTAFLAYSIEAKNAIDLVKRSLTRNDTRNKLSFENLIVATLPAIMGHFETFQRFLFAGCFEHSIYLQKFEIKKFIKNISECSKLSFDSLLAQRGVATISAGHVLADSLVGWHNPESVNSFFKLFITHDLFSKDDCNKLQVLWQLRHAIVHTGGTLTVQDAQRLRELECKGGIQLAFEKNFIWELARKLHPLIYKSVSCYGAKYVHNMKKDVLENEKTKVNQLFTVESSIPKWLK